MQGFSSSGKIKMITCLALQSMNSSCSELLDHEYCTGVNFYHWMSQQEQPCSCNSFCCHQMDHRVQVPRPKKKENVLIILTIKSFKSTWSKETYTHTGNYFTTFKRDKYLSWRVCRIHASTVHVCIIMAWIFDAIVLAYILIAWCVTSCVNRWVSITMTEN